MSTFRASVRVDDGMLHTARPLTAPDKVTELVDSVLYAVANGDGSVTSVDLTVDTVEESGTPIGDSSVGTSSQPLPAVDDLDGEQRSTVIDVEPPPFTSPAPTPVAQ